MNIENWLKTKGSYSEGVFLYGQLPRPNANLLRFFNRGETRRSLSRLRYELQKQINTSPKTNSQTPPPPIVLKKSSPVADISIDVLKEKALEKTNKKIVVAQLPPSLRAIYYEKNKNFYELYELKLQLNSLPFDAEEAALVLIKKIMELRKSVSYAWTELDYFIVHKKERPKASLDVSNLGPMALIQARQRRYAQRSKRTKTLEKWKADLEKVGGKHPRLEAKISNQKNFLEHLEQEIEILTKQINESN